ncbi:hypothetical protein MNAN1_002577 [Malassezia nana]|uniref:Conserved oligomeric Golgi complex subunit 7 n=1 Tax=Malassezia nana TaxID=180528 RepID=A0AAF0J317_9BASI|nr:hypothetical protein MNAN1_002577 [Malassezia nana]
MRASASEAPIAPPAPWDDMERPMDRVAWLQAHLATVGPVEPAPVGPWSQRLVDAGMGPLAPILDELTHLHTHIEKEGTATSEETTLEMQRATQVVPHAVAQVQRVAEQAAGLRDDMHTVQTSYQDLGEGTTPDRTATAAALAQVHRLARAQQHMQVARHMLQAVDSWSLLRSDVSAFLAEENFTQAAERLCDVEASLAPFDAASAYVERQRSVHAELVQDLVNAITPPLIRAVRDVRVDDIVSYAHVLATVGQMSVFDTLYTATRTEAVQAAWHDAQTQPCPSAVNTLGQALLDIVQQERTQLAPALWGHSAHAALVLTAALAHLRPPLATHLRTRPTEPCLPEVVEAFACLGAHAQTWQNLLAPHPAPPLSRSTTLSSEWRPWLCDAFEPFQRSYRELEHACLAHAWSATHATFESSLGRIWVTSLGQDAAAAWTPCVTSVAHLLHEQVALCASLRAAAMERMRILTGGEGYADVNAALAAALYEPCAQRLCTTMDSVGMRFRQHARASAPHAARILQGDDHMDAVHDWDLVRAGVQLLAVARAAHALGQGAPESTRSLPSNPLLDHAPRATPRTDAPGVPIERITRAAHRLVLELILAAFRRHLEAYRVHGAWRRTTSGPAGASAADARVPVPSFSRSPTEGMAHLGEGLLNLPRLLEPLVERELPQFAFQADLLPFAHEDEAGPRPVRREARALSAQLLTQAKVASSAESATDQVLSLWLRSLTRTLLTSFENEVLPFVVQQCDYDRAQLAADVDYLSTMASALNASSAPLREWAD